jgi:hypothetical protein
MTDEAVKISIDDQGADGATRGDLYRHADLEIFGNGSKRLVQSRDSLVVRVLATDIAQTVKGMDQFKTIADHAGTTTGLSAEQSADLTNYLESLAGNGLLISRAEVLSDLSSPAIRSYPDSQIDVVGFITNHRTPVLRRAVTSFVEHFREFGRSVPIVVIDNSRADDVRSACRRILEEVQNRYGLEIAYAGLEEKVRFASALKQKRRVPDAVIDFALFGEDWAGSRAGANRNALLLHAAGSRLLSLDDDSVCRGATLPGAAEGIRLYSESPRNRSSLLPSRIRPFRDQETVLQMAQPLPFDLLQAHERYLGQPVNNCIAAAGPGLAPDLDAASPLFLRRLRKGRSRVLVTLNGLIGDCGWASPSPYLFLKDESLDELVHTEETFRAACLNRNLLRSVDRLTIADRADNMMTLFTGLDNRSLLPPFVPVGRGQDAVFGATLGESITEGCVCYLPWALLHLPLESRRFWPGETLRSASGIPLSFLLSACIRSAATLSAPGDAAESLRRLGCALEHLGMLPAREFQEEIQRRVCREIIVIADELERSLEARGYRPLYWANDVNKFLDILRESVTREEFFVPLDLLYKCDIEEASVRTRHVIVEFGRLLKWWPDLIELSRTLQSQGVDMAQSVVQSVA